MTKPLSLNALAAEIHDNAKAHGWWEEEREFGTIIALCHSELSEALEEHRDRKPLFYYITQDGEMRTSLITGYNGEKPEGKAVEMIDCVIRILDWCGKEGVNVDAILKAKHRYNQTRPYKHGGKLI